MIEDEMAMCRVCLRREENMKCIDQDEEHCVPQFSHFFTELTAVRIDHDSGLSNRICQACTSRMLDAYELRRLALASDLYLRFPNVSNDESDAQLNSGITETDINKNTLVEEQRNTKNKDKWVCTICSKTFTYESELQRHQLTHDPGFECSTCHKVFGFKSSLKRHKKQHSRAGRLPCPQCSSHFPDESLLKRHVQYAHKEKKHVCASCGARFGSASALSGHMRSHSGPELRCEHNGCGKTFHLPHHLKRHEATHTGRKMYFCDECGKGFVQAHHLVSHLATHRPEQRVSCPLSACTKTFPTKYALNRHMLVHEKKTQKCDACGKIFASNRRLRSHQLHCPSNKTGILSKADENYDGIPSSSMDKTACNSCQKWFTSKYLKKHQMSCKYKNTFTSLMTISERKVENINCRAENRYNLKENSNCKNVNTDMNENNKSKLEDENIEFGCHQMIDEMTNAMDCHVKNTQEIVVKSNCQPMKGVSTNIEEVLDSRCGGCCQGPAGCGSKSSNTKSVAISELHRNEDVNKAIEIQGNGGSKSSNIKPVEISELQSEEDGNKTMEIQGNDCKGFLGKCIVGNGADGISEECICAKVTYEDPLPEYLTTPLLVALEQQGYYPS